MPQSLHTKYGHLVSSTRNREPLITGEVEVRLYEYIGGIIRGAKARLLEISGMPDHIHLIIRESKSVTDQDFIGQLKGDSSRWVNQTFNPNPRFAWQSGYRWFSVGPADLNSACGYVRKQKQHHQKITFKDEYRNFLEKYKVDYNEEYVWD